MTDDRAPAKPLLMLTTATRMTLASFSLSRSIPLHRSAQVKGVSHRSPLLLLLLMLALVRRAPPALLDSPETLAISAPQVAAPIAKVIVIVVIIFAVSRAAATARLSSS